MLSFVHFDGIFLICSFIVNEDTYDKGRITSTEGKFELRLSDDNGKVLSSNQKLFDFDMEFYFTNFNIIFDDYNDDGYIDFTLGQSSQSKLSGWIYKIYTIKNGEILELPINNQEYIFTSEAGYYCKQLSKNGADSFIIIENENNDVTECIKKTYKWDGKQFIVTDKSKQQLVSDKNKNAAITDITSWPEHGISIYSTDEPKIGGYKGYKGYYLYIRGKENYYPDWESNYPAELHSISNQYKGDIFAVHLINSDGTSYVEPTIITFNAENMSVVNPGPEYNYFYPPGNDNTGQMVFSGGALAEAKNTDILLMINGELVSDISTIVSYGDVLVPLYQINDKLGVSLNQTKADIHFKIIDNIAYVPLRSVAEAISAEYGIINTESDRAKMIFPYNLAWLDTQSKSQKPTYSQNKAQQYAKDKLQSAFEKYKPVAAKTYKDFGPDAINDTLDKIKTKIDNMKYADKISKYWVFDGPYRIFVDEYTGDIYFQQWSAAKTWIMKIDFSKPVLFDLGYFLD